MPVRVGKMSLAIPVAAALAILLSAVVAGFIHVRNRLTKLFLGFYGCCSHCLLHRTKQGAPGEGTSAGTLDHAPFDHAASVNIHTSDHSGRHISDRASARSTVC